ncbi:SAM-dependent chlorinase/fluorinase [Candidatus Kaiserbacteria bacterium]|nr:SAM-dependent chlorinase/fluorinase [Candidatus Kaiserbacteria bacterium]
MHVTIINDCRDANAAGRQMARAAGLIGGTVSFVGVASDMEAAGNLIDVLDAYGDAPGAVLVNVAPRNGTAKKWENGTPFGYFRYKNVLVAASVDGLTLSLVKKLEVTDAINVLDIPTVVEKWVRESVLSQAEGDHIVRTQFRSYDFLPRIAAYLLAGGEVPFERLDIAEVADVPQTVWWVDNFGNCKTTLLPKDIAEKTEIETAFGTLPYIPMLKDVPDGAAAVTVGSSGLGANRFLEIVVQGGSAAQSLNVSSGGLLFS